MSSPSFSGEEKTTKRNISMDLCKFSTLVAKGQVSSDVQYIYNLPCRLIFKINKEDDGKKFLGFYVGYNEGSDDRSMVARSNVEFILYSRDEDYALKKNLFCVFKHDARIHGFDRFLTWEEMIDPGNAYIVKDEIIVEINIEIHRPSTPSYYSAELSTGYYDLIKHRLKPSRRQCLFRFKIDDVMNIVREYSPTFYVQNMPWRIMAVLHENIKTDGEMTFTKKLGVFLHCYGVEGADNWACYTKVNLDIWNHIPDKPPLRRKFTHFYYKDAPDYGFYSLLGLEELTNESLGLVNKGSVVVEVIVSAEKPFIIPERQAAKSLTINNFVIPDLLAHLYTLEDH